MQFAMAHSGTKRPAWVWVLVLVILNLSLLCSAASSHSEHGGLLRGLLRSKRQDCVDGTYIFNSRTCCKCSAGQSLTKNCGTKAVDRMCAACAKGTYNSEPNNDSSCKPCTSCDQPNANLEVEEDCTAARNTKCKCKKDHYCSSPSLDASQSCLLCSPCKVCGNDDVKTPCTANENTVCNSEGKAKVIAGSVSGVVVAAVVIVGGIVAYLKLKKHPQNPTGPTDNLTDVLLPKDIRPFVPEIAEVIGFKEMERLATQSKIEPAVIESCKLDHPGDSQAQTQKLLGIWVERRGRDASKTLIEMLNDNRSKGKAEKVKAILTKTNGSV